MLDHDGLDAETIRDPFNDMEMMGGVNIDKLKPDSIILIETENRTYTLYKTPEGNLMLKGHPDYCPEFIKINYIGTTAGGSAIRPGVYRGGYFEVGMKNPKNPKKPILKSSQIKEITEVKNDSLG